MTALSGSAPIFRTCDRRPIGRQAALAPETKIKVIGKDDREPEKDKDQRRPWLTGLASLNGGWHGYYRHAISQAHTMIFVGTPRWSASQWCPGEHRDFAAENRDRERWLLPANIVSLACAVVAAVRPALATAAFAAATLVFPVVALRYWGWTAPSRRDRA